MHKTYLWPWRLWKWRSERRKSAHTLRIFCIQVVVVPHAIGLASCKWNNSVTLCLRIAHMGYASICVPQRGSWDGILALKSFWVQKKWSLVQFEWNTRLMVSRLIPLFACRKLSWIEILRDRRSWKYIPFHIIYMKLLQSSNPNLPSLKCRRSISSTCPCHLNNSGADVSIGCCRFLRPNGLSLSESPMSTTTT